MIGFCKFWGKNEIIFAPPPPQQKGGTGAPIPTIFLVYYGNIMKHCAKFKQCSTIQSVSIR